MVHTVVFRINHKLVVPVAFSTALLQDFSFFLLMVVKYIHENGTYLSYFYF